MKILVIVGSKQLNGNTDKLADSFVEGAKKARHSVEKIHLRKFMVNPCLGCNMCYKTDKPCIQNDDMGAIYDSFMACDMVVFASPLHFWTFSSAMKSVIDRLYAVCKQNLADMPKKETALLATAYDDAPDTFDQIVSYYKNVFVKHLGWTDRGMVLASGCGGGNDDKKIKKTVFLAEAKQFGASLI